MGESLEIDRHGRRFSLAGRRALVTGGNGGIGLGIAQALADAGATVAISGRDISKNNAALAELARSNVECKAIAGEIGDEAGCRQLVERAAVLMNGIDILVNNAGTNIRKRPEDYDFAEWRRIIDVNLSSAFVLSQAAFPLMKDTGGSIINIGSMTSLFGAPFAAPYSASKGGVVQLTKALAAAWAVHRIRVNAILPGWITTALTQQLKIDVPGIGQQVENRTPMRRWGTPDDLAGLAVFLASPASDFVTGTAIPVDGGYAAQA